MRPRSHVALSPAPAAEERRVYSVAEITRDIRSILEQTFCDVWVEGEISNCKCSAAGHWYFSLKDSEALLQAVVFNRAASAIPFKLQDGQKVVCFGSVEVYPPHGRYQLVIAKMEPQGIGSLQLALEQLKKKLQAQGLFALEHKRALPALPGRVGVVTSAQGAALRDILKVCARRHASVPVLIAPVRVQGEGAKEDIVRAIQDFNDYNRAVPATERVEVLIVGRGGGSIEDLWAFNEEAVARAIYDSTIPVVSAVGHESDWTIADLVADVRAATPSVAAELVIPRKEDLSGRLGVALQGLRRLLREEIERCSQDVQDLKRRLGVTAEHALALRRQSAEAAFKKLFLVNPRAHVVRSREQLRQCLTRLTQEAAHLVALRAAAFSTLTAKLQSLSPLTVLARGYSITFEDPSGAVVKDAATLAPGQRLRTRLSRGEVISTVTGIEPGGN